MENAGTAAALAIMERIGSGFPPAAVAEAPSGIAAMSVKHERRHQALIFCGKGNNGGDGFVVARKMSESGFCVHVILVDGQPVTEDSVTNFRLLENMPVQVTDMTENERVLMYMRVWPDIIVDAIYGTGSVSYTHLDVYKRQASDITVAHCDYDDGHLEYDIEIVYNGNEYEFEIDGTGGTILSHDIDHHDHWD